MSTRRIFLRRSALFSTFGTLMGIRGESFASRNPLANNGKPVVVSTWNHGIAANEVAWKILLDGGKAIDAVEQGVQIPEADPNVKSVGYGGYPDQDGRVTLDACIMDDQQQCGSVAFLEHIKHPIAVARLVMDQTPHVMLVGAGALEFAMQKGFEKENLLTPETLKEWKGIQKAMEGKRTINNIENENKGTIDQDNHDTIGMLALDANGRLSGACTTSGAANKLHGRVGDSPIIGAGLFVDNEVGAACATGLGEEVIKQAGSAMVVELMRQGKEPEMACKEIVQRIAKANKGGQDVQVGFLALRKDGKHGSYSVLSGFNYALSDAQGNRMVDSAYLI